MTPRRKRRPVLTDAASSPAPQNLKFEREDWSLFRTIEGLQQRAGVARDKLSQLVVKELADNSLDAGGEVRIGTLPKDGGYFVEDNGSGIDGPPEDIARLFSIKRPMVSTKLLRLPTRGVLGNGTRVIAGAVLASNGSLTVTTRNRRIELRPERDGSTTVVSVKAVVFPFGTRVEIVLGPALPCDTDTARWARIAERLARVGSTYQGKSSPHWYDAPAFHELLDASGDLPVRKLVAQLDGRTDAMADAIVKRARLNRTICKDVNQKQAARLLATIQRFTDPVSPKQLGSLGPRIFPNYSYAAAYGIARLGAVEIPHVVEVWAIRSEEDVTVLQACVNRTPVTGEIEAARQNRDIDFFGCGLSHTVARAAKDTQFEIWLNITTPFMPIVSDGKAPNLMPFFDGISSAVSKAVHKARRPTAEPDSASLLPKRQRGRQSPEAEAAYRQEVARFCKLILQIRLNIGFRCRQPRLLLPSRRTRPRQGRLRCRAKANHRLPQVRRPPARHLRRGRLARDHRC